MSTRVDLMGCPVDALTLDGAVSTIEGWLDRGETGQQMSLNAAKFTLMERDPVLRSAMRASRMVTADGVSIVLAARALGAPLPERVTGIDLMFSLLERAPSKGWRPFFLGAKPEVAQATAEFFSARGVDVAGHHHGYFRPAELPGVLNAIAAAEPTLLFVALGSPDKELFVAQHQSKLGVPYAQPVGGAFDVVAGVHARAPQIVRSLGVEWAWRTAQRPREMFGRGVVESARFVSRVASAQASGYRLPA